MGFIFNSHCCRQKPRPSEVTLYQQLLRAHRTPAMASTAVLGGRRRAEEKMALASLSLKFGLLAQKLEVNFSLHCQLYF